MDWNQENIKKSITIQCLKLEHNNEQINLHEMKQNFKEIKAHSPVLITKK